MARQNARLRWRGLKAVLGVLIVAVALVLCWQIIFRIFGMLFPEPAVAHHGTIEDSRWVRAAVIRREILLYPSGPGVFQRRLASGERAARGEVIGLSKAPGHAVQKVAASLAGLIAYTSDGMEYLSPETALSDPQSALELSRRSRMRGIGQGRITYGQPVARLVFDTEQYLLLEVPPAARPREKSLVWVEEAGKLIPAVVAKAVAAPGNILVLRTDRFPRTWLDRRVFSLRLVLGRYTGTVLPLSLLRWQDGRCGVWTLVRSRKEFVSVDILGKSDRLVAVAGIDEGTVLLR